MLTGLSTATTALGSFQTSLSNIANNLANVETTAFKSSVVGFQDLVYSGPAGLQVGNGVKVGSISPKGFTQGTINSTGRDTDLAIQGKGFFAVQLPNGTIKYTRDGSFTKGANGRLVTSAGNILQPQITIPIDALATTISPNGTVSIVTSSAPNTPKVIGQIQTVSFENQEGLLIEAGNLYSETLSSGPPNSGTPGTGILGSIKQSSLEQSNVDTTTELTSMVTAQQGYSANSKVINTTNQMLVSALGLIR